MIGLNLDKQKAHLIKSEENKNTETFLKKIFEEIVNKARF